MKMFSRIVLGAIVIVLAASGTAHAQKKAKDKDKRGLTWDHRPSIVFGQDIHLDVRMKLVLDWRHFNPPDPKQTLYDFHSLRFGLKGEATRHFGFEFEIGTVCDGSASSNGTVSRSVCLEQPATTIEPKRGDWKDVYLDWHTYNRVSIQGGRFKVPFSLEQLTGSSDTTDFAYRSLAGNTIAPSRDKGGMVYGRFFGRGLTYQLGVFNGDGDNGRLRNEEFIPTGGKANGVGPSVAGRVTAAVLRSLPVPARLKSLRLGAAYTLADLPEGLNSLKGKSVFGDTYFSTVYVKGHRQRIGAELDWTPASFGIKAEWMQSREDREQQGNRNQDLSDFLTTGWYVSGSWVVTGENKSENLTPKKPLFKGGIGAIEVAARYDQLGFRSATSEGPAFTNPRADHLVPNTDQVWTFGVNYFANRWVRLVGNAIHEHFEDPKRSIVSGTAGFWSLLFRFQLDF